MIEKSLSSSPVTNLLRNSSFESTELRLRNDRQAVFELTRELVNAQFNLDDKELICRLWQEVADRGIDINRIIHLMYGCCFHDDDEEMLEVDLKYDIH